MVVYTSPEANIMIINDKGKLFTIEHWIDTFIQLGDLHPDDLEQTGHMMQ